MRDGDTKVLATLVTVEEAPRDILDRVAAVAMKTLPQLVGVTWSKEGASAVIFTYFHWYWGKNMQKLGKLGMAPHEIKELSRLLGSEIHQKLQEINLIFNPHSNHLQFLASVGAFSLSRTRRRVGKLRCKVQAGAALVCDLKSFWLEGHSYCATWWKLSWKVHTLVYCNHGNGHPHAIHIYRQIKFMYNW